MSKSTCWIKAKPLSWQRVGTVVNRGIEAPALRWVAGKVEQRDNETSWRRRRSQSIGLRSCNMNPLLLWPPPVTSVSYYLSIITQPPSLPSNRWVHAHGCSVSLPPLSRSITLMHCGSVGCCVRCWMGSLKLFPSLKSLFLSRSVTFIPSSYSSSFLSRWELLLVFLLLPMLAHQTCMCFANRIPRIGIQLMLNSCTWVYLRSNCC